MIVDGLTKEQSRQIEKEYIIRYETWNPDKGYNTYVTDWEPVGEIEIDPNRVVICVETGELFDNIAAAAAAMQLSSPNCIARVLNNPKRKSRGYHWVQPPKAKGGVTA